MPPDTQWSTLSHMEKLRPIVKSAGVPLMQEVRGTSLTSASVEALMRSAEVISEGLVDEQGYSGSSMLSIDLGNPRLAISTDSESLRLLCEKLRRCVLFRSKLLRMARAEAERRAAPRLLTTMEAQTDFRLDDKTILIDIVVDCGVAAPVAGRDRVEGVKE